MKAKHEVDPLPLLKEIWEAFRSHFERMLDEDLEQDVDPGGSGRIDVEIVFNALEWCKPVIAKHFACREAMLKARAAPLEGTTWATQAMEKHGWGMLEYLLDFSISHGAIPVAIGQAEHPAFLKEEKFELMLGAESEMGYDMEVTRDLLKLLDTKCRIKVLVYAARTKTKWIGTLKGQMEAVFNIHASDPTEDAWIVIGVPTFSQWVQHEAARVKTPRQLYLLRKEGEAYVLQDMRDDWWSW